MCNYCDQISETQPVFYVLLSGVLYWWQLRELLFRPKFLFLFSFLFTYSFIFGGLRSRRPYCSYSRKKDILSRHCHIAGIFSSNWQVYILKYFLIVKALYTMRTSQWVQTFKWFTQIERERQKMAGRNILRWNYVVKATHRFLKASFMSGKPNQSIGDAV